MSILLKKDRRNTIYISGPMSNYENYNFYNFNRLETQLKSCGWNVENPATKGVVEGADWQDYMAAALLQLGVCGSIFMLRGWEESKGARIEHDLAKTLGMRVFYEGAGI